MKIVYLVRQLTNGGMVDLLSIYTNYFSKNIDNKVYVIPLYSDDNIKNLNLLFNERVEIKRINNNSFILTKLISVILTFLYYPIRKILFFLKLKQDLKIKSVYININNILSKYLFPINFFIFLIKNKPDIIHSLGLILDYSIILNFLLKNNAFIYSELEDPINRKMNKFRFVKFLNICSLIITPSQIISNKLITFSNDIQNKLVNIPFLIKNIPNNNIKIFNNTLIIGASGILEHRKGYHILIEALYQVNKKNSNWRLIIAGDGKELLKLKEQSKELNIFDKITFLGWIDNINSFFSEIDIFIHTSFTEGGPMVVTEALSQYKPIITTDVGYVREMVNDDNGFIIEMNNSNVLAEKINYFIDNPDVIEKMSLHSRKIFEEKFSQNTILSKIECTYELLKSKKNGTKENI